MGNLTVHQETELSIRELEGYENGEWTRRWPPQPDGRPSQMPMRIWNSLYREWTTRNGYDSHNFGRRKPPFLPQFEEMLAWGNTLTDRELRRIRNLGSKGIEMLRRNAIGEPSTRMLRPRPMAETMAIQEALVELRKMTQDIVSFVDDLYEQFEASTNG